jgi:hypothetical protein
MDIPTASKTKLQCQNCRSPRRNGSRQRHIINGVVNDIWKRTFLSNVFIETFSKKVIPKRNWIPSITWNSLTTDYCTFFSRMELHLVQVKWPNLEEVMKKCLAECIKKDEWPSQSPDCNPMDYHVHVDSLSEKVYRGRTEKFTKEELKQRTTECWEEISLTWTYK